MNIEYFSFHSLRGCSSVWVEILFYSSCHNALSIFILIFYRLIKITDSTLDVVFSRFMCVSFTITLKLKPKGVTRSRRRTGSLCLSKHLTNLSGFTSVICSNLTVEIVGLSGVVLYYTKYIHKHITQLCLSIYLTLV